MNEMGFNKNSSPESQKAFLKSLFKLAREQEAQQNNLSVLDLTKSETDSDTPSKEDVNKMLDHQMSLFDQLGGNKKSS